MAIKDSTYGNKTDTEVLQTVKGVHIWDHEKTFDPYQEAIHSHNVPTSNILFPYLFAIVIELVSLLLIRREW